MLLMQLLTPLLFLFVVARLILARTPVRVVVVVGRDWLLLLLLLLL